MPVRHAAAFPLLFLLLFPACLATISSSSSQQCQLQCVDRNIAFPLSAYELTWPNETLSAECDFDCRIESCRLGCADLDENSNCEAHCDGAKSRASCQQACRAIADVFLNQIQRLINQVAVEADLDLTQGILLNWSFDQTHEQTLKEALAANLRWFAQISSTNTGWRSTALSAQAFRESKLFATVYVPVDSLRSEVRFRLAAVWRNTIITSPTFHQTFPTLPAVPTAPTLLSGLQITANSYALCWLSERQPAGDKTSKYRLVLKSKSDEEPLRALETQANCHLFRQLPAEDCCNVLIEDISDGDHSTASLKVAIEMRPSTVEESEKPKMMVTNGTVLLRVDDLNDYAMLSEPTTIPFLVPAGQSITALTTISSTELLIGLSDGSIQYADISGENSTTIQRELRAADGSAIAQLAVDHVQKFVYAVREQSLSAANEQATTNELRAHMLENLRQQTTEIPVTEDGLPIATEDLPQPAGQTAVENSLPGAQMGSVQKRSRRVFPVQSFARGELFASDDDEEEESTSIEPSGPKIRKLSAPSVVASVDRSAKQAAARPDGDSPVRKAASSRSSWTMKKPPSGAFACDREGPRVQSPPSLSESEDEAEGEGTSANLGASKMPRLLDLRHRDQCWALPETRGGHSAKAGCQCALCGIRVITQRKRREHEERFDGLCRFRYDQERKEAIRLDEAELKKLRSIGTNIREIQRGAVRSLAAFVQLPTLVATPRRASGGATGSRRPKNRRRSPEVIVIED
ncbi:hypothetical protein M3Y99_01428200 [Aphelenchoides fujianensis]|nr:hypothetical protein M3Y99_01428200 [Aphelenchoides fujianensis]